MSIVSTSALANASFLPAAQAFQLKAESVSQKEALLQWNIAPHYYLYHNQFKVMVGQQPLSIELPKGTKKNDPTFGITEVHYYQVAAKIQVKPKTSYQVSWQGCSADGLCYPVQRTTLTTDQDGLFPQLQSQKNGLLQFDNTQASFTGSEPAQQNLSLVSREDIDSSSDAGQSSTYKAQQLEVINTNTDQSISSKNTSDSSFFWSNQWNNDQVFLNLFSQDSWLLNLLIFFIFGILLAFLPCSLPLIPILSGIIVQRKKGYKAIPIATAFVVSMALVYALMGMLVAGVGYNFQRWFQSPPVIIGFALLFVVFALNLLGLFQLSLPQGILQRLDRIQNRQTGGTIYGAAVMGVLSALIVGPCMSAPLAGSLLFVSQTQSPLLGGLYLFMLGLGIGLPLFIAAVFGARFLPRPGLWMERLKFSFGFIMLMMAVYFIRPLLSLTLYYSLFAGLLLALVLYLGWITRQQNKGQAKILTCLLAALLIGISGWNIKNALSSLNAGQHASELHAWQVVRNAEELNQVLARARQIQRPIVIDVYADWCVACQPIERDITPRADVQGALKSWQRIKLDLSHYQPSQNEILSEREILGPPTVLFLQPDGQEKRELRLTGAFNAEQLIRQLRHTEN